MAQESRLSITIDSRSAEQQAVDLEKALKALEAAGVRVTSTTGQAGRSADAAGRSFSGAGRDARQGAGDVDKLNRSLRQTDEQAAAAAATVGRVFKAALAGFSVMHVIDVADEWGQYASRMKMATESQEEYNHAQDRMVKSAQLTFRAINETRESFIQLSPVLRQMGQSLDQSIDTVEAFSSLLVVNGANAERGAAAMQALAKSLQKGRVDADAWVTIYSTVDTIVDAIAASSGKTAAEIRKMGVEGKISAELLAQSLLGVHDAAVKQVEEMPTTVRDSLRNLSTVFGEYVGQANEANGATQVLVTGINALSANFNTLVDVGLYAAAGALALYTSRSLGALAASSQAMLVQFAKARATLAEAKAEADRTAIVLASTRANLGLSASMAELTAATLAQEAASKRLAAAQAATTTAGRALLGVLGGPAGMLLTVGLAATAFYSLRPATDVAVAGFDNLQGSLDETIAKFKELNTLQRQRVIDLKTDELGEQSKALSSALNSLAASFEPTLARGAKAAAKFRADFKIELEGIVSDSNLNKDELANALSGLIDRWATAGNWSDDLRVKMRAGAAQVAENAGKVRDIQAALDAMTGALASNTAGVQANNAAQAGFSEGGQKYLATLQRRIAALQDGGDPIKEAERFIRDHADSTDLDTVALMSNAHALKTLLDWQKSAGQSTRTSQSELERMTQALREQVSVLGMTEEQAARHRIETAKGTQAQKAEALALLEHVQAQERLTKAKDAYKSLLLDLRTEQEKAIDQFREQKQVLDAVNVSADEYARVIARMSAASISAPPQFGGLDASVGGASSELLRVAEARAALDEWRATELAKQQEFLAQKLINEQQYADNVLNITQQTNAQQETLQNAWRSATLGTFSTVTSSAAEMLRGLGQEGSLAYKALFVASKAANIAQAILNTENAYTQALALPGNVGLTLAPYIRGLGYASVGIMAATSLTGMAHDGIDQVPREGTWLLDKGERVLNPRQNADLTDYLQRENSNAGGQGAQQNVITVQVSIDQSGMTQSQTTTGTEQNARQLGDMIAEQVRVLIAEETRQGGVIWNLRNQY